MQEKRLDAKFCSDQLECCPTVNVIGVVPLPNDCMSNNGNDESSLQQNHQDLMIFKAIFIITC